ncbi:hypothetical protein Patl1_25983 [Pistacia atlantica]|uniref:Uncharacterized protein n=1 Tax=Pistacia atlantica TaxID=434234 RepID=A0ACC1B2I3_9ROSI|nr:hypothetical protein Patl1_25983 [Pistacia atlantica]
MLESPTSSKSERAKNVLSLLEKNYKTLQALGSSQSTSIQNIDIRMDILKLGNSNEDQSTEMDGGSDDEMELENGDAESEVSELKDKVVGVLKEGQFEEKRASKLTQQEFLYLLSLFNKAGIRFS